ncbi:KAP family P-loop NTPase fold protein [Pseudodesulfovibrio indicus]|nr:P-loop NTPase fold protein [Pseudodesulfovibrio indicus]TDT90776.1 KAP-like P-loop domain-containing protein [Pseudodesulfovibrio indicus]
MLKRNIELNFSSDELKKRERDGETNPWFASDQLDRGAHVNAITDLMLTTEGSFVLTLSSPWGTGKTTFMRMWKAYLEYRGRTCILFNAWQNDYADNPFLTFIAEMCEQLEALNKRDTRALRTALDGVKKIGKKLFPRLLSIGVKTGLGISVDFEKLGKELFGGDGKAAKDICAALTQLAGDSLEGYASEVLEGHSSTKKLVQDFRQQLEAVVSALGDHGPLFFFVDELDRCKPTYAVELLEAVKHLFETSGIIFVLSLDREQLGHSVKAAYGDGIDADGYLRRFIDLEYRIPDPDKVRFIQHLAHSYGFQDYPVFSSSYSRHGAQTFINEFSMIAQYYSLRTIEKAFLRGSILMGGIEPYQCFGDCTFWPHFIFMRELSADYFKQIVENGDIPEKLPLEFSANFPGLNPSAMHLWGRLKHKYEQGDYDMNATVGRHSAFEDDVRLAVYFFKQRGVHLIDNVVRLLDLSERLVPIVPPESHG